LRNGLLTAPALYVLERNDSSSLRLIELINNRSVQNDEGVEEALTIIRESGGVEQAQALAVSYGAKPRLPYLSYLKVTVSMLWQQWLIMFW
jgi:geranylgeranyl pyrophosphate synthase